MMRSLVKLACVCSLLVGMISANVGHTQPPEKEWKMIFEEDLTKADLLNNWIACLGRWSATPEGLHKGDPDTDGILMLREPPLNEYVDMLEEPPLPPRPIQPPDFARRLFIAALNVRHSLLQHALDRASLIRVHEVVTRHVAILLGAFQVHLLNPPRSGVPEPGRASRRPEPCDPLAAGVLLRGLGQDLPSFGLSVQLRRSGE